MRDSCLESSVCELIRVRKAFFDRTAYTDKLTHG